MGGPHQVQTGGPAMIYNQLRETWSHNNVKVLPDWADARCSVPPWPPNIDNINLTFNMLKIDPEHLNFL